MSSGPQTWWRAVLTYPPTWVAGVILAVVATVFVAAVDPPASITVAAAVVSVLAVVAWPIAMSATGVLAARQFAVQDTEAVDSAAMASLATDLKSLDDSQPFEQLVALGQKRTALMKVLDRRLDRGELTHARYVSTSQQVYDSAVANLREVAVANDSVSSIDSSYIQRRIAELDRQAADSESVTRERETLAQRSRLRDEQIARIQRLIAQNEAALTTLDSTTSVLADMPVGQRPEDADDAMAALSDLAARMHELEDRS